MLSSQTPAQERFQIRIFSALGEGRECKGSLAVRNLILSSIVNTQLAAGQAFKVERSTGTCFRYIPSSIMGWKNVSWRQQSQLRAKAVFCLSCGVDCVSSACVPCLRTNSSGWYLYCYCMRWPLLWLSGPNCCPLKTGGRPEIRFKYAELSPWSPLYFHMCFIWLVVKQASSESQFSFPIDHGFKNYPLKSNINRMAEDKRIKICI